MKLKPEKHKEMIVDFLQCNATKWQPFCMNGKQVEVVTVFKLLGVYLSSDLTWTAHCEKIIKKANRRLYALRKLKKSWFSSSDIVVIYCTVIRTMIEYASVVFANLSQTLRKDLERVQKRAMSIIYRSHSYTDALYALQVFKPYVLAEKKLVTNLLQISKQVTHCTLSSTNSYIR